MTEEVIEKQKSSFITVVAWVFIVLTGFGTLMASLQNIMIHTLFPMAEVQEAMNHQEEFRNMPFFVRFMFNHFQFYFLFMFFLTVTTFVSAIGLLKRKNWARRIFIFLMAFGVLFSLASFFMQFPFNPMTQGVPQEEIPVEFARMMTIMKIFMSVITAGITGLFCWILKKLMSKDVIQEFRTPPKLA